MTDRPTSVQFGQALKLALEFRSFGQSTIVSAHQALDHVGISRDWTVPLVGTLDSSPTIAEAWAERRFNDALDRAAAIIEGEHSHG